MSTTEKQTKRFEKLDEEWRVDMMGRKDHEDLNKAIRECAISIVELRLAKEIDEDLARIREELATANEGYKKGEKENTLRIEFLVECLKSRGIKIDGFSKKKAIAAAASSVAEAAGDVGITVSVQGQSFTIKEPKKA